MSLAPPSDVPSTRPKILSMGKSKEPGERKDIPEMEPDQQANWAAVAEVNRKLFDLYVRNAKACSDQNQFEHALQWCWMAAAATWGRNWFGHLSSRELDVELLRIAQHLPKPSGTPAPRSRRRWLHVMTEAYETFGHTNQCRRWIELDTDVVHDVLLLVQNNEIPENLIATVKASGGELIVLDPLSPLLQRAKELRDYAWKNSDIVTLHTHPDEILTTVAFGIEGGPPVLFVNHSDHVFWAGPSISDLVLEIRSSGEVWTKQLRGINRTAILPVPLLERVAEDGSAQLERRKKVRQSLGIPENATVLLTTGAPAKYRPMPGLNFIEVVQKVIQACENMWLIAIGPRDDGAWREAKNTSGGRILPLGYERDSRVFGDAADIYLEGFPVGSLTAMLEAGQCGVPCVRAPAESAPPFSSDSPSLDATPQPGSVEEYISEVISLIKDPAERVRRGAKLREAIESNHCGKHWLEQLERIKMQVPQKHRLYPDFHPAPADDRLRDWWLWWTYSPGPAPDLQSIPIRVFTEAWKRTDVEPKLESSLLQELCGKPVGGASTSEKSAISKLNRSIRRRGQCEKFIHRADVATRSGRIGLGRKFVYCALFACPPCIIHPEWGKLFIKTHTPGFVIAIIRKIRSAQARKPIS